MGSWGWFFNLNYNFYNVRKLEFNLIGITCILSVELWGGVG